jgi:hypothetical protein
MEDCNICCEPINGKNPSISCLSCEFETCSKCAERYLLETPEEAHCMSCRIKWPRYFMMQKLTNNFVTKKYKNHRENVLLDMEKSLLPQTQPDVDLELARRQRHKLLQDIAIEKMNLKNRLKELDATERSIYLEGTRINRETGVETSARIRKCPVNNCRGFLDNKWSCGICHTLICNHCNEPKDENHECDPNDVETMKLLKKDSKPCPSCGTLITKIDGCDQMWCTKNNCHTPFSWRTGRKVNGPIHNPHYIQFNMEHGQQARDPRDELCGGLPDLYTTNTMIRRQFGNGSQFRDHISNISYLIWHIQRGEINDIMRKNAELNTTNLRVIFMLGEIDEKEFKTKIQQREKRKEKNNELLDILTMFVNTGTDIMRNIYGDLRDRKGLGKFNEQLEIFDKLIEYTNSQFEILAATYKVKKSHIINYRFSRNSI